MKSFSIRVVAQATAAIVLATSAWHVQADETLRTEVGKPLQAAQDLIKAQKYKEALGKVREADAVGGKSGYESYTIERMRLAAASGAGDLDTATKAYDALNASGRLAQPEKLRYIESIAGTAYRAHDYAKTNQWGQRYVKEGGNNPAIRTLITQSEFLSGDYAGVIRDVSAEIQAAEKAGTAPSEDRIKLLLSAATKLNDNDRYVYGVEKLLTYYPKKQYWGELLARLQNKPQFSDRFALDTYRLALATDSLTRADDYVEFAQLAAQAGYPTEGLRVVDKGYAAGILGTGPEAARHKRLHDLLVKRSEEDRANWSQTETQARASGDGAALVKLGFNLVLNGQSAKGEELIREGIGKSGQQTADASKLHLGIAQVLNGNTSKANATFRSISGRDGTGDLARLWGLYVRGKSSAA